jgi:hypothetical protein
MARTNQEISDNLQNIRSRLDEISRELVEDRISNIGVVNAVANLDQSIRNLLRDKDEAANAARAEFNRRTGVE